jgi:hypothetical protein
MFRNAALAFLALAVIGLIGWVAVRFTRPILGVSHDGFLLLTAISLGFAIAINLTELAHRSDKSK